MGGNRHLFKSYIYTTIEYCIIYLYLLFKRQLHLALHCLHTKGMIYV